ncbi:MAG: hypothetical protein KJZ86_17305 [Caldilineaceae bacterium]|nr:hypothetical protein [Caldilineaceae bacterium]HRJ42375.1 AvaI/BsoBI family type II restriction endonuclease [Caldilineaceae bacterium]
MAENLPSFVSSKAEIRRAVEQNAIDRGTLFVRVIVSLDIDGMLGELEQLSRRYDKEEWREQALSLGIHEDALDLLDTSDPPIPYVYYFVTPELLTAHPRLIFYYRNVAMLSSKAMRGIGLDTSRYESGAVTPDRSEADELSIYFNQIVSALVRVSGVTPQRHVAMLMANLGDSMGGMSRNEVGRTAMMRLLNPLVRFLHRLNLLASVGYSYKGSLEDDEIDEGMASRQTLELTPDTDIENLLGEFERNRVKYHELLLCNGGRLLVDRQLKWDDKAGNSYKVGPDLHSTTQENDFTWAAEVKGGADPAGSDEHWKTATQALNRILDANQATDRPQPALAFVATIFVERVAQEAQKWIDAGKLTAAYNLTQMLNDTREMERFCSDVTGFLNR